MTSLKFRLREYAARPGVDVEAQVLLHDAANTIEELIGGREMTMRNMDSLHRQIAVLRKSLMTAASRPEIPDGCHKRTCPLHDFTYEVGSGQDIPECTCRGKE